MDQVCYQFAQPVEVGQQVDLVVDKQKCRCSLQRHFVERLILEVSIVMSEGLTSSSDRLNSL